MSIQPIDWRVALVDSGGKPSPEFQRKWGQIITAVTTPITSAQVIAALGYTPVNKAGDTITGALTVTGQLIGKGTATNNDAAAGNIGEFIKSTISQGSAVSLISGTAANVTSISLTAGDWDVWFTGWLSPGSGTTATYFEADINTVSATRPSFPNDGGSSALPGSYTSAASISLAAGPLRIKLASTTTVYAIAFALFSGGTATAWGSIRARRVR